MHHISVLTYAKDIQFGCFAGQGISISDTTLIKGRLPSANPQPLWVPTQFLLKP